MPTFTRSSFNLGGSYQPDAMDQVEQWNANRGDQWSRYALDSRNQQTADDWRKEVALKQLGLQSEMYQGGRADNAEARKAQADALAQQFGYMKGRDELGDKRWNTSFEQDRLDREEDRNWKYEGRARDVERYDAEKPMRDINAELAMLQLSRLKERQSNMGSGASSYVPVSDQGKEAFQFAKQATGDLFQAGVEAKKADKEAAMLEANAMKNQLVQSGQDFAAKDKSFFSGTTDEEKQAIIAQGEAYKAKLKSAGMPDSVIQDAVSQWLRQVFTSGGRTDWNQGPSEDILRHFGVSFQ